MQIEHFENVDEYYKTVKDYLLKQEASHCLMLGLCSQRNFKEQPYLAVVTKNNTVVAAAIRTPPHKLVLSQSLSKEAITQCQLTLIAIIARDLASRGESLPGVMASQSEALTFAKLWQSLTGQSYHLGLAQRIYQLEVVQPITVANGYLRLATKSDRSLLINWIKAFSGEALGENEPELSYQNWCDRRMTQNSLYIWQDNIPVSMASFGGTTPNGIRISAVYTPPEYRRRGYARSCVAAISQTLLDRGRKYCFLFTDLANSTSNSIYQKIGYKPICDVSNYWFED